MNCSAFTDTQRLDWLQSTKETVWRVSCEERRPRTDGTNETELVSVFEGWTVDDTENPKTSIRDAIDCFIHSQNADAMPRLQDDNESPEN